MLHIDDTGISFKYKDYADARLNDKVGQGKMQKVMKLTHEELFSQQGFRILDYWIGKTLFRENPDVS